MMQSGAPAPAAAPAPAPTWRLWVAPIVWSLHFLAIYGVTALLCERQGSAGWFGADVIPWFVAAATLVAALVLLATLAVAVRDLRRAAALPEPAKFVHWLGAAMAGLALLAVLWETLPVLMLAGCS